MTLLKRATIKSYDAGTHQAAIGVAGSLSVWLEGVPVDVGIAAAEVVAGRECAVVFFTDDNPNDSAIVSIHRAVPTVPIATLIRDADADTIVATETSPDEDKIRMTIAGTLRYLMQAASPHHTITGDAYVTERLDVGNQGGLGTQANVYHDGGTQADVNVLSIGFTSTYVTDASGRSVNGLIALPTFAPASGHSLTAKGLSFFASAAGAGTFAMLVSVEGRSFLASPIVTSMAQFYANALLGGSTATVAEAHGFRCDNQGAAGITDVYHFRSKAISGGANRRPFWEEGSDDDDGDGNAFYSNTRFGTLAVANVFGGGDGVIHLHDARVAPTTNPAAGGILYSVAGALKWRGSAGTVTTIAPA